MFSPLLKIIEVLFLVFIFWRVMDRLFIFCFLGVKRQDGYRSRPVVELGMGSVRRSGGVAGADSGSEYLPIRSYFRH